MKKIFISLTIFLSVISSLNADDHLEIGGMAALQCQFADGKDMDDVMKVLDEWSEYGDDNFTAPYSAWIFTPVYRTNSDFDFDFMFLGFTSSMQEMGRVQDNWQAGGSKIDEKCFRNPSGRPKRPRERSKPPKIPNKSPNVTK